MTRDEKSAKAVSRLRSRTVWSSDSNCRLKNQHISVIFQSSLLTFNGCCIPWISRDLKCLFAQKRTQRRHLALLCVLYVYNILHFSYCCQSFLVPISFLLIRYCYTNSTTSSKYNYLHIFLSIYLQFRHAYVIVIKSIFSNENISQSSMAVHSKVWLPL